MSRLSLPSFKPGNLRCVKVWFHASSVKSDQGSPSGPKGIAVYLIFPVPHPLSWRKLKKAVKLPSHSYLPTPNISFSPSSLHFRPEFSLVPIRYPFPLLEVEAVHWPPHGKEMLRKTFIKKGRCMCKFRACLYFISLIHTTWWDDLPCEISSFPSTVFCSIFHLGAVLDT